MTHLDPETLALLALGEDAASATERLHLAGCPACRAEVGRFARTVSAAREDDEPLLVPAPRVWSAIVDELGLEVDPGGTTTDPPASAAASQAPRVEAAPLRGLRRRSVVAILAAAAAVLVVGGAAVGLLQARQGAQTIATATLHAFPGWQGDSGTAVLERLPSGREVVRLTTTVQPDPRTDHQVWLMTAGAKRLVSLGLLHGTSGTFAVPAGLDVSRFRLVDVSDEPRDGNPAHSGDSIIRGALRS